MSRLFTSLSALLIAFSTFSGCNSTRTMGQAIVDYPVDRAMDFVDVIGFDVYMGQGFLAQIQATKLAQIGAGVFDGDILKCRRRSFGLVQEMRAEAGLPLYYFTVYDRKLTEQHWGNETFRNQHEDMTGLGEVHYNLTDVNDRGFYEVGANLAVFVGVGVSADAFQALDLMAGFIGIDIGRDDRRHAQQVRAENPRYQGVGERPVSLASGNVSHGDVDGGAVE